MSIIDKPLVMVFSGQGPQNLAMGRVLFDKIPLFNETIRGLDALYKEDTGISLIDDIGLFGNKVGSDDSLNLPHYTVVSIAFLQLSLFELLRKQYEIIPDVVVGHSLGELAMLYASDQLPLIETAKIVIARSEAVKKLPCMGGMIAVTASASSVQKYLEDIPECTIAAYNSPKSCTVSGTFTALKLFESKVKAAEPAWLLRYLSVGNAYHSPLMKQIKDIYLDKLKTILAEAPPKPSPISIMSTVTGTWYEGLITPQYCWDNVELPVHFAEAITGILAKYPQAVFLEIAPHPVLSSSMEECGVEHMISLMHKLRPELEYFAKALPMIEKLINKIFPKLQEKNNSEELTIKSSNLNAMAPNREDIAIIGIGCRFPGGVKNKKDYWELLVAGKLAIQEVPADRWDAEAFYSPQNVAGKIINKCGGFMENVFDFDYSEFGISLAEAQAMDPAQRILLEVCYQALEDSAICFRETKTGVFVGGEAPDHIMMTYDAPEFATPYNITGIENGITANHISFVFDLQGPSLMIDTACASSLTSLHVAVNSIYSGDCEQAVVAGINLLLEPTVSVYFSRLGVLSPSGRCHVFDEKADGYVRSEGCGAVIIKPLTAALRDGNTVYAVIKATGASSNGATKSLTMPSFEAQQELFARVLTRAQTTAEHIDYAELHGTGTPVGDPVEVSSAGEILCHHRLLDKPLGIGSVKGNLGHLEYAAGMASLIKVALMLKHRCLVPTIGYEKPNPMINWDKYSLNVVTDIKALPPEQHLKMTVSAYGFGGANAMALLATVPDAPKDKNSAQEEAINNKAVDTLFVVGGLNRMGTERLIQLWQQKEMNPHLASTIMLTRARPLQWHSYAIGNNLKNLVFTKPQYTPVGLHKPVIFAIAGDGGHHPLMGHYLYHRFAVFRNSIHEMDDLLKKAYLKDKKNKQISELYSVESLLDLGYFRDGSLKGRPTETERTLAVFIFHMAVIDLLLSFGIKPDAVHGSSLGEFTAAYTAGEMNKKEIFALRNVLAHIFVTSSQKKGGVLNILAAPGEKNIFSNKALHVVQELMEDIPDIYVSIENDPTTISVSGTEAALSQMAKKCDARNIKFMRIDISTPVHSPLFINSTKEQVALQIKQAIDEITNNSKFAKPKIPVISSYTGLLRTESLNAQYLTEMILYPTRLKQAFATMIKEFANAIIIEIAPSAQLAVPMLRCGLPQPLPVASEENEVKTFLSLLGELALINRWVDPTQLNGAHKIDLDMAPSYPFEKKYCSIESANKKAKRLRHKQLPFSGNEFYVGITIYPWLADHQADNNILFPATGYIEIAMKRGFTAIKNLYIHRPWVFNDEPQLMQVSQQGLLWNVQQGHTVYASGEAVKPAPEPAPLNLSALYERITDLVSVADHYRNRKENSLLAYGLSFQLITEIKKKNDEILATVSWEEKNYPEYLLPPPVLDCALQLILPDYPNVITKIALVTYYHPLPQNFFIYAVMKTRTDKGTIGSLYLCNEEGTVCVSLEEVHSSRYTPSYPPTPNYYCLRPSAITIPVKTATGMQPFIFTYTGTPQSLVNICLEHNPSSPFALWIICENVPESAAILGLGRSLINEYPNWQVKLIRINHKLSEQQRKKALQQLQESEWQSVPQELYLEESGWFHPALAEVPPKIAPINSSAYFVEMSENYGIEGLRFSGKIPRRLNPDEVRIDVQATGINFKDALIAMGSIQIADSFLGLEVSGIISETGKDVTTFKPGDTVFALSVAPGFSNQIIAPQDLVAPVPSALSFAQAASLPVVYITCIYALIHRARIKQGDKVLIHSAAGSIGQAAIQICLAHGCEVMATVHDEHKKEYLQQTYGIKHFADSHDIEDWSTKVKEWSPEGVQCIVNSLANESLFESLRCLADEGSFIELGKRDFLDHTFLDMNHLLRNISFYSIHIDLLMKSNRRIFRTLFCELCEFINSKHYKPILNHVYPVTEIKVALSDILNSQHIGKLVISDYPAQILTEGCRPLFHPEKYYVVLGGCGALGMELLSWLVQEGARHIVLTSRHTTIDPGQLYLLEWARTIGVEIIVRSVDSTDKAQMKTLFSSLNLPLGGVFLLSAVFDDKPISKLDAKSFAIVSAPKTQAADRVMELVDPDTIEFFILFSSVSSVFGNPGQGNYAFANAYLDELARTVPYVRVINLPGIMNVGQLKNNPQVLRKIEAVGLKTCRSDAIGPMLKQLLLGCEKQIIAMSAHWGNVYQNLTSARSWIPKEWLENSDNQQGDSQGDELSHSLRALLAATFGIDEEMIDDDSSLVQYGLDSLNATAISNKINQKYNTELTQLELLSGISFADLCKKLQTAKTDHSVEKLPFGMLRLNSSTQDNPIFFLHDITGNVDVYRLMCAQLNVPCYGISRHPSQTSVSTLNELAAIYTEQIKQIHPEGPYRLAGWSAGGTIAWAIAHQLQKQQQKVERVILIDSIASIASLPIPEKMLNYMHKKVDYEALALSYITKLTDNHVDQFALYKTVAKIKGLSQRIQYIKTQFPMKLLALDIENITENVSFLMTLLLENKELQPLDCEVNLFIASESERNISKKIKTPTPKLIQQVVKGNHWSLLISAELYEMLEKII